MNWYRAKTRKRSGIHTHAYRHLCIRVTAIPHKKFRVAVLEPVLAPLTVSGECTRVGLSTGRAPTHAHLRRRHRHHQLPPIDARRTRRVVPRNRTSTRTVLRRRVQSTRLALLRSPSRALHAVAVLHFNAAVSHPAVFDDRKFVSPPALSADLFALGHFVIVLIFHRATKRVLPLHPRTAARGRRER